MHEFQTMQGFFTFSAEPTEDLGLEDADSDGSDDESPFPPALRGQQTLSNSSDDEGDDDSSEEMEESSEQSSDPELSDEDEDDVYLNANIYETCLTLHAANLNAFAKKLNLKTFPIP